MNSTEERNNKERIRSAQRRYLAAADPDTKAEFKGYLEDLKKLRPVAQEVSKLMSAAEDAKYKAEQARDRYYAMPEFKRTAHVARR